MRAGAALATPMTCIDGSPLAGTDAAIPRQLAKEDVRVSLLCLALTACSPNHCLRYCAAMS
jgi:hypothetical protein